LAEFRPGLRTSVGAACLLAPIELALVAAHLVFCLALGAGLAVVTFYLGER
jgi:hypothetical protein